MAVEAIAERMSRLSPDVIVVAGDAGNTITDPNGYQYTYDYENRLVSAAKGLNNFTFSYNGLGDRYQQTVNGGTATYVLDLASRNCPRITRYNWELWRRGILRC